MPLIELYENRIPLDEELPIQLSLDVRSKPALIVDTGTKMWRFTLLPEGKRIFI